MPVSEGVYLVFNVFPSVLAVPCIFNLTAPEGYIETPQPSSSHYYSSVDCTYTVTVYMGYGVEIQVRLPLLLPEESSLCPSKAVIVYKKMID